MADLRAQAEAMIAADPPSLPQSAHAHSRLVDNLAHLLAADAKRAERPKLTLNFNRRIAA